MPERNKTFGKEFILNVKEKIMLERRFLNFVGMDGIFMLILGVVMLVLPKITSMAIAAVLAVILAAFGIYRIVNSILERKYIRHVFLNIAIGLLLLLSGIFLFFYPVFNLLIITSAIGVYFILESLASIAFAFETRGLVNMWWMNLISGLLQFFLGFVIIIGLPQTALWTAGILLGVSLLVTGMSMLTVFMATKFARI